MHSEAITIATHGRGTTEITSEVQRAVAASGIVVGLCNVFIHHTSASLIVCENADPSVRSDLERFAAKLVPDGDPLFEHIDEGVDDMPAHVRSILTQTSLALPIDEGRCSLGTWQGVFLWEHRHTAHRRKITLTLLGR
ncbi:MAG: YjbQ family protein [Myxococcales bacterium]|nr:YjbQ family protein [Myxococcales bacterium]